MSSIGKNIKKIRAVKKLSQNAFAKKFNLSRTSVGSYEEGRAEPKIDTIIQIANYFGVSLDVILKKELTINDLYNFDIFEINKIKSKKSSNNHKQNDLTPYITIDKRDQYLESITKKSVKGFSMIKLPINLNVNLLAFEHEGSEMRNEDRGIQHGDTLVCSKIEKIEFITETDIYVVILDKNIITRRLAYVSNGSICFSCDNSRYGNIRFEFSEIKELYKVVGVFSTVIPSKVGMSDKIFAIEQQIKDLRNKIDLKEN